MKAPTNFLLPAVAEFNIIEVTGTKPKSTSSKLMQTVATWLTNPNIIINK